MREPLLHLIPQLQIYCDKQVKKKKKQEVGSCKKVL